MIDSELVQWSESQAVFCPLKKGEGGVKDKAKAAYSAGWIVASKSEESLHISGRLINSENVFAYRHRRVGGMFPPPEKQNASCILGVHKLLLGFSTSDVL